MPPFENDSRDPAVENLAQTLARELPQARVVLSQDHLHQIAVPKGMTLQAVDLEKMLDAPVRAKGTATFADAASFLAYVARFKTTATIAWCAFDPQTFALSFEAVLDDHTGPGSAGWRGHRASFTPALSHEWKAWKGSHKSPKAQVEFAEWIQEHETDIRSIEGFPTSIQMLAMATDFVANEERSLKSAARLQSGGVRLTYVADPDKGTTEAMQLFERFCLGIPVFHGGSAWQIVARLKYRINGGKVSFHYELVRPDRVHEEAAKELIGAVRTGLEGVPLLMGSGGGA